MDHFLFAKDGSAIRKGGAAWIFDEGTMLLPETVIMLDHIVLSLPLMGRPLMGDIDKTLQKSHTDEDRKFEYLICQAIIMEALHAKSSTQKRVFFQFHNTFSDSLTNWM